MSRAITLESLIEDLHGVEAEIHAYEKNINYTVDTSFRFMKPAYLKKFTISAIGPRCSACGPNDWNCSNNFCRKLYRFCLQTAQQRLR